MSFMLYSSLAHQSQSLLLLVLLQKNREQYHTHNVLHPRRDQQEKLQYHSKKGQRENQYRVPSVVRPQRNVVGQTADQKQDDRRVRRLGKVGVIDGPFFHAAFKNFHVGLDSE